MVSSDTRTSSMLSVNTTMEDGSYNDRRRRCGVISNCFDMCFNRKSEDQFKLYDK